MPLKALKPDFRGVQGTSESERRTTTIYHLQTPKNLNATPLQRNNPTEAEYSYSLQAPADPILSQQKIVTRHQLLTPDQNRLTG
jgi:hypothetical protein